VECGIVLCIVAVPLLWLAAYWILRPTVRAAQTIQGSFRFRLADFVWLVLQLQLVLAAIVRIAPLSMEQYHFALLAFGLLSTIALWFGSVQFLSKAGITGAWRRGLFILLYLPGTLAVLIGGPIAFAVAAAASATMAYEGISARKIGMALGLLLAPPASAIVLRLLGEWLVRTNAPAEAQTA
jgi:hypothetical protein